MTAEERSQFEQATRQWLEELVIGLNLCPFARKELVKNRIRFVVTTAGTEEELLGALTLELAHLDQHPGTETTLLIHPNTLADFMDYNDFLDVADGLLVDHGLDGIYQVASFHPDYQFAGTEPNDPENFTNRSPFPMLHLLREASVEQAIESYPDINGIPERNIELMNRTGVKSLRSALERCLNATGSL